MGRKYLFGETDQVIVNALNEFKVLRGSYLKEISNKSDQYVKTRLRWLKDQGYIGNVQCYPDTDRYPNLTRMNDPLYYLKRRAVERLLNQEFVKEYRPEDEDEFEKCLMVSTVLKETPSVKWMHSATVKQKKNLPSFVPMILGTDEMALAYYQKENLDYRKRLSYGYETAMSGGHFKYYGILCKNRKSRRELAKWWHNHLKGKDACFFTAEDLSTIEMKLNGGYEEIIKLNAEGLGKVGVLTKSGHSSLGPTYTNEQGKSYTIVDLTSWDVSKIRNLATVRQDCFIGIKTNRELNDILAVYPPLKKSSFNRSPIIAILLDDGGVRVI